MADLRDLHLSPRRTIPSRLLSVTFVRSGGPGGQNVNKVASKADLRLDCNGLDEVLGAFTANRLRQALARRIDGDGQLRITSSEHREQSRNLAAALARLERLLQDALRPRKVRVKTRPSRAARKRRLDGKKHRGKVKALRRDPRDD